jgi:hypothetical protein
MRDEGTEPQYRGQALLLWILARRRGFTHEWFDAELQRSQGDRIAIEELHRKLGVYDGPDVPMPFPEDYDQPDHMLSYGSPGHVLDEHGSVDGCHWND